jgi:hypothetical protein
MVDTDTPIACGPGITGTSKDPVVVDYGVRLQRAINDAMVNS